VGEGAVAPATAARSTVARLVRRLPTLPLAGLAALSLAARAAPALAATTEVTATVAGGALSITTNASSLYAFSLDGSDQSASQPLTLYPSDQTGTGDGWDVTVSSTPLETSGGSVASSSWSLSLNGSTTSASATTALVASDYGSGTYTLPSGNTAAYPVVVPGISGGTPTPATVYSAQAGSGLGDFQVPLDLWLSVPADASSGTYTATLTWTIAQGPSQAYADTVEASSPAAFWQLDEASGTTAADSSGNGYAGTYEGSYVLAAATAPTGTPSVDLNGGYVSTPYALPSSVDAVTYEAWVDTTEVNPSGNNGMTIVAPQGANTLGLSLGGPGPVSGSATGGDLCFWYWDEPIGRLAEACSGSAINDGHWHFVVAEYSGTNGAFSLYVDGAQVPTWAPNGISTTAVGPLSVPGQVQLGTSPDPGVITDGTYTGELADVAIYAGLLSASQIQQQYTAG
jgi:hypothetical protein